MKISTGAVQLLREYTGRGPTKAKTTIDGDVVTVLLEDTLTKGERKLAEKGGSDRVLALRHDFQTAMQADLVALVEDRLGRKVVAFMSENHIDPDLGVETFVLEPAEDRFPPRALRVFGVVRTGGWHQAGGGRTWLRTLTGGRGPGPPASSEGSFRAGSPSPKGIPVVGARRLTTAQRATRQETDARVCRRDGDKP
jgi:uncharacterized protein YbcI